jgi:ribonuclease HI
MQAQNLADLRMAQYVNPTIHTDSQFVIDAATKYMDQWIRTGRTNSGRKPGNLDLLVKLKCVIGERKITWLHVRAHSGDFGNDAADALAKTGAREFDHTFRHLVD